jgi:hypothetical protein
MATFFTVGNQRPDTDDRVVDVLGELVAQFSSNLVIALADVTVGSGEAYQIADRLHVPHNDARAHMRLPKRDQPLSKRISSLAVCGGSVDFTCTMRGSLVLYHLGSRASTSARSTTRPPVPTRKTRYVSSLLNWIKVKTSPAALRMVEEGAW